MTDAKRNRAIEKIIKILKLAESTSSEAEASNALAKAAALKIKYNLTEEDLSEGSPSTRPTTRKMYYPSAVPSRWVLALASLVSDYFKVVYYYETRSYNEDTRKLNSRFTFYGEPLACELAEYAFHTVVVSLEKAKKEWLKSQADDLDWMLRTAGERRIASQSFMLGFIHRIDHNLKEFAKNAAAQEDMAKELGTSLMVITNALTPMTAEERKTKIAEMGEHDGVALRTGKASKSQIDMDGYADGQQAAEGVTILSPVNE